ncbi:hypothetical protein JCM8202_004432 [Rhodotorula sphaerocarpa]
MSIPVDRTIIEAAEARAREHHAQYDPSHDFFHVDRVRKLSLAIANSLAQLGPSPDLFVVELAALFHDLIDAKYLPAGSKPQNGHETLAPFWAGHGQHLDEQRRRLVEDIVDNVSYSKEVKRIAAGGQTDWHLTCPELHCVQDADKLDAIGAFGVMRCAAYSAIANRPLFVPPPCNAPEAASSSAPNAAPTAAQTRPSAGSSALDHFDDKLFKLEGMMKTPRGRELARRRTETMRRFVDDAKREWEEAASGLP